MQLLEMQRYKVDNYLIHMHNAQDARTNRTKMGQACHIDCIVEWADLDFQEVITTQD